MPLEEEEDVSMDFSTIRFTVCTKQEICLFILNISAIVFFIFVPHL